IGEMDFTKQLDGFHQLVKCNSPISENHNTEITPEITTETASAREGGHPADRDADAALLQLLVGHGVGRSVARKLVRDKPDASRMPGSRRPRGRGSPTPSATSTGHPPATRKPGPGRTGCARECSSRMPAKAARKPVDERKRRG